MGTGKALYKAGPDIGELLTQSWFLYGEQQIYLTLWSIDIFRITAEQVSQPNMQVDLRTFRICYQRLQILGECSEFWENVKYFHS